ncbi:sperm acrosome membrane-associated protein 4 [Pelobates fuscus]|uniref:sperm acrosome membrane-associated protein 4 n=1 Tax=Pelobates fuscus TaxID=191477 RepID=UPI002FE4ED95
MKTLITGLFFVLLSFHLAHSLECYQCDYGTCLIKSKVNCGPLESCVTYSATVAGITLRKRGCATPTQCITESSETYTGVTVKTTPSCCISELCNSAITPRLSAVTGIAVLVALWFAKLF